VSAGKTLASLLFLWLMAGSASAQEMSRESGDEVSGFDNATVDLVAPSELRIAELANRPVLGVSVETTGRRWQSKPAVRSVELGAPLTPELARRAMDELTKTGEFAQVYADARPYHDGAILRLVAVPRRLVANIDVDATGVSQARLRAALGIAAGSEVTEPILREVRSRVLELYRRHGYVRAKVTLTTNDTDDPMKVVIRLAVAAGEPQRIARRIFVLDPVHQAIVKGLEQSYRVGAGRVADEDELAEADNDFADLLRKRGFLQVSVKHRVLRSGANAFLYVFLQSGPRYQFRFERARAFDQTELMAALELDKGAEPSLAALTDRIAAHYQKRGFFDVRVTSFEADEQGGAVRTITFEIHEGDPVRVNERRYPCLAAEGPKGLRAKDLGDEIDALLEDELPGRSILSAIDESVADDAMAPAGGKRAPVRRLGPASVYHPESYRHAIEHLEQLLHSKGYLNAIVGPVSLVRAKCDPKHGGGCRPLPLPKFPEPQCRVDVRELPLPEPELGDEFACTPDPRRGIRCAPDVVLSIPIHLGPETRLYDVVFEGSTKRTPKQLLEISGLALGKPLSQLQIDAARVRIQNAYADDGYFYATVHDELEYSPDRTRARARFSIAEREPVVISAYEVRGAVRTDEQLILGRLALCRVLEKCKPEEKYFRRSLVRDSEEQIATLGTFSSVAITLDDPDIPQKQKRVIISVVEQPTQYLEPRIGFSTGEGFRVGGEYGHRNAAGKAIALTIGLSFGYLPDFLIIDTNVRDKYARNLSELSERIERSNTIALRFPDIGLGPNVSLNLDGIDVRDNQRDFGLTREALLPVLNYRPVRTLTLQLGTSVEVNDVTVFESVDEGERTLDNLIAANPNLANLLRVPDGRTLAVSQRISATWDRRDNAFAATSGTLVSAGIEHVSALPLDQATREKCDKKQVPCKSEFLKLTARTAGYIRLTDRGMAIALSVAGGYNLQLTSASATYPDRLFFMGGVNTIRGFGLDAMVPEDTAREVIAGKVKIADVTVRGGDLYFNPRAELRIPLTSTFSAGLFLDTGNVWKDPANPDFGIRKVGDFFSLRYATGAGLRASTPVGPIALDGGVNLIRREWEDVGAIHFSIGLF
jgi:outer membrane protein assembly factor BamA